MAIVFRQAAVTPRWPSRSLIRGTSPTLRGNTGERIDGLYFFREHVRRSGLRALRDEVFNLAWETLGDRCPFPDWFCEEFTDASDDAAIQLANCFAADNCSEGAEDDTDYEEPGPGRTVSPDQFLGWDSPETGGAYGHIERISYRDFELVREYRWAESTGSGVVTGTVTLDGGPLPGNEGVRVYLPTGVATFESPVAADGSFLLGGVPAGTYEVHAQAAGVFDCNMDDAPDAVFGKAVVAVLDGETSIVNVDMSCDPPPSALPVTIQKMGVRLFRGHISINDDEDFPFADEHESHDLPEATCEVSPLRRRQRFEWFVECVGDEVVAVVEVECNWRTDNSVDALVNLRLFEQDTCNRDKLRDDDGVIVNVPQDSSLVLHRDLDTRSGGGDFATLSFSAAPILFDPTEVTADELRFQRAISVDGHATIVDHENEMANESVTSNFFFSCDVTQAEPEDPAGPVEEPVTWIDCAGAEVLLRLQLRCSMEPSTGAVTATVDARLFEHDTCVADPGELDDSRTFSFDFPPLTGDSSCVFGCTQDGPSSELLGRRDVDHAILTFDVHNQPLF